MQNTPENNKSEYVNTGLRDGDARQGFGDDAGTRVGRPDGAGSNASAEGHQATAQVAPHDVSGPPIPGQAGTNTGPVPDGIEGSEMDGEENAGSGAQQRRVQAASEGINEGHAPGDAPRVDDL